MSAQQRPVITVAIPALNEAANIGRCLASIREHFPPDLPYEILVGDHGSSDGTPGLVRGFGVRAIDHRGGTVGGLRNRIVEEASGDVLVFLDADTAITADWGRRIAEVVRELAEQPLQVTGSFCQPPPSDNPFIKYWFARMTRTKSSYLGTGHMITTRTLFERLRGFDPALRSGEDYEFCQRARAAGAIISLRPEMPVFHYDYPTDVRSFLRREMWHGAGDFQSWQAFRSSRVAQAAVLIALGQLGALAMFGPAPAVGLVLQAGVLSMVGLASCYRYRGLDVRGRCFNVMIYYLYFLARAAALLKARA